MSKRSYGFDGLATYICPEAQDAHDDHGVGLDEGDGGGHVYHAVAFLKGDQEFEPPDCHCGKRLELHCVHDWTEGRRGALLHESGDPLKHDDLFRARR